MLNNVYITTLGRVNDQVTLRQVPWATLVVQTHEEQIHREAFPDTKLLVLPPHIKTISTTREYLMDVIAPTTREDGIIFCLDDDLGISIRRDPNDYHLKVATQEEVKDMFAEMLIHLQDNAHVAVSGREGQNRLSPDDSAPVFNGRYMRLVGFNTKLFPADIGLSRVNGYSDFDINLQLLRAGRKSTILTRWAQGHRGTQTPGGISEQRTHESHEAEGRLMCEMHEGFVKGYFKENKTGGEFGKRFELRVQWKKAFESYMEDSQ